ncbi:MAG: acetyl-CoA carboxylase biotin carboxyl carrier protein subunit [Armatimonadota bacterium]|nr:acetyl-CoA carboxylase biotin carboxyl carrier protein subunit [Armatimonadota bacterium]MDR7611754.1 acetyl-CoA carboxylase biotin carboxyl carrier protein subunit [Armatimonadota bacterium]
MEIRAPLTGTVLRVLVSPGEWVRASMPVVVLESMKMEIAVDSAFDGVVTEIRRQPGDLVQAGDVLVVLDSATPEGT